MKKKLIVLAVVVTVILAGCSGNTSQNTTTNQSSGTIEGNIPTSTQMAEESQSTSDTTTVISESDNSTNITEPRQPNQSGQVSSEGPYNTSLSNPDKILTQSREVIESGPNFTIQYEKSGYNSEKTLVAQQRAELLMVPQSGNQTLEERNAGYMTGDFSFFTDVQMKVHAGPDGFYRLINDTRRQQKFYLEESADKITESYEKAVHPFGEDQLSNYEFDYIGTDVSDINKTGLPDTVHYYQATEEDIIDSDGFRATENQHTVTIGFTGEGRIVYYQIIGTTSDTEPGELPYVVYSEHHTVGDVPNLEEWDTSWTSVAKEFAEKNRTGQSIPYGNNS
jgi:hypothetical protein